MVCARECVFTQSVCAARARLAPRQNAETLDSYKRPRQHFCASAAPGLMCKQTLEEVQNNARKVKKDKKIKSSFTQTNLHLLSKSASMLTPAAVPRLLTMEG